MSYTLNDALLALSRYCLAKHGGISTALGTNSTLVDATRKGANDQFNNGIIFFLSGAYAGQFATVTDYASTTGTFTFSPSMAASIQPSVQYEAYQMVSGLNMYDAIGAINQALDTVGDVLQENTALVTVDGQESYDLPSGVYNVQTVEIARETSTPYRWMPSTHWHEINDDLRFPNQFAYFGDDYTIRLTYLAPHDTLADYDDVVNQQINTQWLKYKAAVNLLRSQANRGVAWGEMKTQYEEAQDRLTTLRPKKGISVVVKGA